MPDRPGVLPEDQPTVTEADPVGYYLVVRGTRYEFLHSAIDAEDSFECQLETGHPVEWWLAGEFSMAAMAVMWWLGRRHAGQRTVKIRDCVKEFPTSIEVAGAQATDGDDQTMLQLGEILDDDENPSPEDSGRKSDPTGPPSPSSTASTHLTSVDPPASA